MNAMTSIASKGGYAKRIEDKLNQNRRTEAYAKMLEIEEQQLMDKLSRTK